MNINELTHEQLITSLAELLREKVQRVGELENRLRIELKQFTEIRGYTQDGKLAAICADHEDKIRELLK